MRTFVLRMAGNMRTYFSRTLEQIYPEKEEPQISTPYLSIKKTARARVHPQKSEFRRRIPFIRKLEISKIYITEGSGGASSKQVFPNCFRSFHS